MRNWERPMVTVDTFVANEFVSTCGQNHKVYNFECNAGDEDGMYDVFTNDGRNLTKGILNYYHPCKATHKAEEDSGFIEGVMIDNGGIDDRYYIDLKGIHEYPKTKVIIWTDNGTDVHCTTNLNMKEWTTAKS